MIKVGKIINTHALKGECKIYLVTDEAFERFEKGKKLYLKDGSSLTVKQFRIQKGFGYCFFEGIDSIEKAEKLKNEDLWIHKKDLPELDEDTFYYHELMNCMVFNQKNEELGTVVDILETGANLVLRVKKENHSFLVPFVSAFIENVDIENKKNSDYRNGRIKMKISVLSLFPEYFDPLLNTSIIKRAKEKNLFEFEVIDFRMFTKEKHGHVDDTPYGGGAGMVLMCQPLLDALASIKTENSTVILLTPQGKTFNQKIAMDLSLKEHLIFICGHYEGFDERIREYVDIQMSLGDFVLTGGESACMVMCDCILRLLPGVIRQDSSQDDSFSNGLLEYPQYTRPEIYDGKKVPDVLLSGHHANIKKWRHQKSLENTFYHRPDLLETLDLSKEDKIYLDRLKKNCDLKD